MSSEWIHWQQQNQQKAKKDARKRKNIIDEIISTEERYVSFLAILKKVFIDSSREHLQNSSGKTISDVEFKAIFGSVETILSVNKTILEELRAVQVSPEPCVGRVFLALHPYLKMYTEYVESYDDRSSLLTSTRTKRSQFDSFLKRCESDASCESLRLHDFLIMPIQRIPRYRLLLEDLLSCTPESHPDYTALLKALEGIRGVADHINHSIKRRDNRQRIVEIQKRVTSCKKDSVLQCCVLSGGHVELVSSDRVFLLSGCFSKVSLTRHKLSRSPHGVELFLFNDILVYTRVSGKGLVLYGAYMLQNVSARVCEFSQDCGPDWDKVFVFSVVTDSKKIDVHCACETSEERDRWVRGIVRMRSKMFCQRCGSAFETGVSRAPLSPDFNGHVGPITEKRSSVRLSPSRTRNPSTNVNRISTSNMSPKCDGSYPDRGTAVPHSTNNGGNDMHDRLRRIDWRSRRKSICLLSPSKASGNVFPLSTSHTTQPSTEKTTPLTTQVDSTLTATSAGSKSLQRTPVYAADELSLERGGGRDSAYALCTRCCEIIMSRASTESPPSLLESGEETKFPAPCESLRMELWTYLDRKLHEESSQDPGYSQGENVVSSHVPPSDPLASLTKISTTTVSSGMSMLPSVVDPDTAISPCPPTASSTSTNTTTPATSTPASTPTPSVDSPEGLVDAVGVVAAEWACCVPSPLPHPSESRARGLGLPTQRSSGYIPCGRTYDPFEDLWAYQSDSSGSAFSPLLARQSFSQPSSAHFTPAPTQSHMPCSSTTPSNTDPFIAACVSPSTSSSTQAHVMPFSSSHVPSASSSVSSHVPCYPAHSPSPGDTRLRSVSMNELRRASLPRHFTQRVSTSLPPSSMKTTPRSDESYSFGTGKVSVSPGGCQTPKEYSRPASCDAELKGSTSGSNITHVRPMSEERARAIDNLLSVQAESWNPFC
eukprot:Rmarinus@m.11835